MHITVENIERAIRKTPDGNRTFFDSSTFSWIPEVEAQTKNIQSELQSIMNLAVRLPGFEEIQEEQRELTADGRWQIFPFCAYGVWFPAGKTICPQTVNALKSIPGLKTAMFSILQPGKEIPPHRGPYAGVLRYHLGVLIPSPPTLCGIRVGSDVRHWEAGKSLVFDDSHEHEAWNRSLEARVVLFVDFERPLPLELKKANSDMISAIGDSEFVSKAAARWEKWFMQNLS